MKIAQLKYFEYLDKVSNVLNGEIGIKVDSNNNNNNNDNLPTLIIYYPINTGSHYWSIVYMIKQLNFFQYHKSDSFVPLLVL